MKAVNIIWDTDGENIMLPNKIDIPNGMENLDEISDYISDETGFCHKGFELDFNGMTINCPDCEEKVVVEFDTARCDACGWMCADAELENIMTN